MNSMELANGMMYVDSIRLQQQQLQQMMDYEYFYRNKKKLHSYVAPKKVESNNVFCPYQAEHVYAYEDVVEFPIESYDVLNNKLQAVLSIEENFLVFSNSNSFDWEIYRERIIKGLKKYSSPLVSFIYSDNTLFSILLDAGFEKELIDKKRGKILYRLERK